MKIRESGMPGPDTWDAYFEPELVLDKLALTDSCRDAVEFGCGYGTFTIPAARRAGGTVHALDIDGPVIEIARKRARDARLRNVEFIVRDFVRDGTGLPDTSMDYAMMFNILHHDDPVVLLSEAYRTLKPGGLIGIMHWNYDPDTPRGPPMDIRPRPEHCRQWAEEAGFVPTGPIVVVPPFHYGLVLRR